MTFSYDNLGNRTAMSDGLGSMAYAYDSLSRMTSETRDFSGSLPNSPDTTGTYELEYTYHLGGGLKSYKDPWNKEIAYSNDKTGRLTTVTGTSFGSVTSFANNPQYRAWGALKHLEYGASGRQSDMTFDSRLQPLTHVVNEIASTSNKIFDKDYEYYADGRLKLADENESTGSVKFDRLFTYDHQGRAKNAKSGTEAHGDPETDLTLLPYRQAYTFNAFGNVTSRDATMWDFANDWDFDYSVTNNRIAYHGYDNDGRHTVDPRSDADANAIYFEYNAPGHMTKTWRYENSYETTIDRDGTGAETKRSVRSWIPAIGQEAAHWSDWEASYFINSSVLGQTISETTKTGKKLYTYVIGHTGVIARQHVNASDNEYVAWKYVDASGLSTRSTATAYGAPFKAEEFDALGNNIGTAKPILPPGQRGNSRSPNESADFSNPLIGNCAAMGTFGPCTLRESPFANDPDLPIEVTHNVLYGRDSATVARDIMRSIYGPIGPYPRPWTEREIDAFWLEEVIPADVNPWWEELFGRSLFGGQQIQPLQSAVPSLTDIVSGAMERLKIKSCRSLFNLDVDPTDLLNKLAAGDRGTGALSIGPMVLDGRTLIARAYTTTAPTARLATVNGHAVWINTGAMTGAKIVLSNANLSARFGLSSLEDRVLTLLHELGHAANLIRNGDGTARPTASVIEADNDSSMANVSIANSNAVFAACFGPGPREGFLLPGYFSDGTQY